MISELYVFSAINCPKTLCLVSVGQCLFNCEHFKDYGDDGQDEIIIQCTYEGDPIERRKQNDKCV